MAKKLLNLVGEGKFDGQESRERSHAILLRAQEHMLYVLILSGGRTVVVECLSRATELGPQGGTTLVFQPIEKANAEKLVLSASASKMPEEVLFARVVSRGENQREEKKAKPARRGRPIGSKNKTKRTVVASEKTEPSKPEPVSLQERIAATTTTRVAAVVEPAQEPVQEPTQEPETLNVATLLGRPTSLLN